MNTDTDSARLFLTRAKSLADSLGNIALLAEIEQQLGNSYWSIGSYNKALECYLAALPHYDTLKNHLGIAMIYNNLGEVYKKLNNQKLALSYHNLSLQTKITHIDSPPLMSYYNIGELYQLQGELDTAQYFYQTLLKEANFGKDQRAIAYAYSGLGQINIILIRIPIAISFLEKALKIRKEIKDQRGIAQTYMDLSSVYIKMARHSFAAKKYADSAAHIIRQINAKDLEIENYDLLASIDSTRGNYLSAMKYQDRHHALKDSLYSLQKTYQINELLTSYETERTIRENQALLFESNIKEAELRSNQTTIILISTAMIIAILFSIRLKIVNNTVKNQKEELALKAADLEKALNNLEIQNEQNKSFSYTVSHDLKAPIRVISYYCSILKNEWKELDVNQIQKHLDGIGTNLKRMQTIITDLLDLSRVSQAELSKVEVDITKVAHEILDELMNASPTRQVDIQIQEEMTTRADEAMVRILLKNLLENAWKYTEPASNPVINLVKTDDQKFVLTDNGVGFDMQFYAKLFVPFKRLHGDSEFE
ncbi:MAG: tetratricopeptide repeat protein, partial [Bacteroidota bacterium]